MAETLWTVEWSRPDDPKHLTCHGLTLRLAFRRVRQVIKNSGPITIHRITAEVQTKPLMARDGGEPVLVREHLGSRFLREFQR